MNYLIDKFCNPGKGGNINYFFYVLFALHSLDKAIIHFQADDYTGQNSITEH